MALARPVNRGDCSARLIREEDVSLHLVELRGTPALGVDYMWCGREYGRERVI